MQRDLGRRGDSWGMPSAAGSPPRTNEAVPVRAALTGSSRDRRIKKLTIGDSENTEISAFTSGGGWCRGCRPRRSATKRGRRSHPGFYQRARVPALPVRCAPEAIGGSRRPGMTVVKQTPVSTHPPPASHRGLRESSSPPRRGRRAARSASSSLRPPPASRRP